MFSTLSIFVEAKIEEFSFSEGALLEIALLDVLLGCSAGMFCWMLCWMRCWVARPARCFGISDVSGQSGSAPDGYSLPVFQHVNAPPILYTCTYPKKRAMKFRTMQSESLV